MTLFGRGTDWSGATLSSSLAILFLWAPGFTIKAANPPTPGLTVTVDPRVELFSLIFRLAGHPEYNQAKVETYVQEVEQQFGPQRSNAVVKLARQLRRYHGVSYDACMSIAVHVSDAYALEPVLPWQPWPEGLDKRLTQSDAEIFLRLSRQFVRDSGFKQFVEGHHAYYEETEARLRKLMADEAHLEWFESYFGARPSASFILVPALLNGGGNYGVHCQKPQTEELYSILGVYRTDASGKPEFTHEMLSTIVHEFAHSFANGIIMRHLNALEPAGKALYEPVAQKMRAQAYGNGTTLLCESLVRACEVRYANCYEGSEVARRVSMNHKSRGFLWMDELSALLADYEQHRDRYRDFEAFTPQLITFFTNYAASFAKKQKEIAGKRPKIVSMTPKHKASNVDPSLTELMVVFDRPMRDSSWSLVGDSAKTPQSAGSASYDAARKVWTLPVKLKPGFTYEFGLNDVFYDRFRSAEDVPLEPTMWRFTTKEAP